MAPTLHFDTQQEWLHVIASWAASVPEIDQVWAFGSRATGVRSPKDDPPPVPDFDIAYTMAGDEPGALLALSICESTRWMEQLQAEIGVLVDLQLADPEDAIVWPAVLQHGVLIYSRSAT